VSVKPVWFGQRLTPSQTPDRGYCLGISLCRACRHECYSVQHWIHRCRGSPRIQSDSTDLLRSTTRARVTLPANRTHSRRPSNTALRPCSLTREHGPVPLLSVAARDSCSSTLLRQKRKSLSSLSRRRENGRAGDFGLVLPRASRPQTMMRLPRTRRESR
jgi:hypothetical protein